MIHAANAVELTAPSHIKQRIEVPNVNSFATTMNIEFRGWTADFREALINKEGSMCKKKYCGGLIV